MRKPKAPTRFSPREVLLEGYLYILHLTLQLLIPQSIQTHKLSLPLPSPLHTERFELCLESTPNQLHTHTPPSLQQRETILYYFNYNNNNYTHMSFFFSWRDLKSLDIREQANEALSKLSLVQFPQAVSLKHLILGTSPPRFEVIDIIDLHEGRFKGLFKFKYEGEMHVTLNSKVEINPLRLIEFDDFTKPHFVLADKPTVLPVDFDLKNVRIDAFLTVVYNGKGITVVFNDSPIIDLDIKTSIDELLDEELFETMKKDALAMATEFLKQDLPEMISQAHLFDDETQRNLERNLKSSKVSSEEGEAMRVSFSIDDSQISKHEMDHNLFNTLSLEPTGFSDVIQRISLSHEKYQNLGLPEMKQHLGAKKRRNIKMGKKKMSPNSTPSTSAVMSMDTSMNTMLMETIDEKTTTTTTTTITTQHQIKRSITPVLDTALPISQASSPTLIDTTFSTHTTLEEYLLSHETLVFDIYESTFDELEDPYVNMTHPMDIAPEYEQTDYKYIIPQTKLRPRGTSSNYMKFGAFREKHMNEVEKEEEEEEEERASSEVVIN